MQWFHSKNIKRNGKKEEKKKRTMRNKKNIFFLQLLYQNLAHDFLPLTCK